jgi:hypothetical protein
MDFNMNYLIKSLDILGEAVRLARLAGMATADLEVEDDSIGALSIGAEVIAERIASAMDAIQDFVDSQPD